MILFILLVFTSVHWTEQHLTYPINYCQLAAVCIHDHSMVCAATEDGCSRRTFLDQCDMYEYNCDFGAHCRETYKLFCLDSELDVKNPPPLSYHRPAPCATQPVYCFTGTVPQMSSTTPAPCVPKNTPAPCVPNTPPPRCVPNTPPPRCVPNTPPAPCCHAAPCVSLITSTTTSTTEAPTKMESKKTPVPVSSVTCNIYPSVETVYLPTTPADSMINWPSEPPNTLPPLQPILLKTSWISRPPTTTPTILWILWPQKPPKTLPAPPIIVPPTARETLPPTTMCSPPPTVIWPPKLPKSSPTPPPTIPPTSWATRPPTTTPTTPWIIWPPDTPETLPAPPSTIPPTSEETLVSSKSTPSLINWPLHKKNKSPPLPPSLPLTPWATRPPTTTPTTSWILFPQNRPTSGESEEPTMYPPKIMLWPPGTPKTMSNIRHTTQTLDLPTLTTRTIPIPAANYFYVDANGLPNQGVYSISTVQENPYVYVQSPKEGYTQSAEQTNEPDQSPEKRNEDDQSPENINEDDQSPEMINEVDQSPQMINEGDQSAEPLPFYTSSPQPLPEYTYPSATPPVYTYPPTSTPVYTYPSTPPSVYTYPPTPTPGHFRPPPHNPGHFHPPGPRAPHDQYFNSPEQYYHDHAHYGSGECLTCEIIESCEICNLRLVNKSTTIKKLLPKYSRPLKNSVNPTTIVANVSKIGAVTFGQCCDRPKTWVTREEIRLVTTVPRTTKRKLSTKPKTQPTEPTKVEKFSTTTTEASSTPFTTTEAFTPPLTTTEVFSPPSITTTEVFSPPSITTTEAFSPPPITPTEASSTSTKIPSTTTTTQEETRTTAKATDTTTIKIDLNLEEPPSTLMVTESTTSTDKPETSRPPRYTETTWWYPTMCNDKRCDRPYTWITTVRRRKRRRLSGYHQ